MYGKASFVKVRPASSRCSMTYSLLHQYSGRWCISLGVSGSCRPADLCMARPPSSRCGLPARCLMLLSLLHQHSGRDGVFIWKLLGVACLLTLYAARLRLSRSGMLLLCRRGAIPRALVTGRWACLWHVDRWRVSCCRLCGACSVWELDHVTASTSQSRSFHGMLHESVSNV